MFVDPFEVMREWSYGAPDTVSVAVAEPAGE